MATNRDALLRAAEDGDDEAVAQLLAGGGIDVNADSDGVGCALHLAATWSRVEVMRLLLAADGIDVNSASDDGERRCTSQSTTVTLVERISRATWTW